MTGIDTASVTFGASSKDWFQDLRAAYKDKEECGFGVYYHSIVVNESALDMARARHDGLLAAIVREKEFHNPRFTLQPLRWPAELGCDAKALSKDNAQYAPLPPSAYGDYPDEDDEDDEAARAAEGYDGPDDLLNVNFDHGGFPLWYENIRQQCRVLHGPEEDSDPERYSSNVLTDRDATPDLKRIFNNLRTDSKLFREHRRVPFVYGKKRFESSSHLGLFDGILDEVFIVVDPYSAYS